MGYSLRSNLIKFSHAKVHAKEVCADIFGNNDALSRALSIFCPSLIPWHLSLIQLLYDKV